MSAKAISKDCLETSLPADTKDQLPTTDLLTPEQHPEFWYIHGKAYDLSQFIHRHPGGSRALLLTRGRDCTEMFESYHCLTDKPKSIMAKFEVGKQHDYQPYFDWTDPQANAFQTEVISEVRNYVAQNNIDIKCSMYRMTLLSILYVFVFWSTVKFYWMEGAWWSVPIIPVLWWVIFVNTFHDATHFAMSKNMFVTHFWTYVYPWFSSPTTWDHQHVIGHHVYTNIHKLDPDLNHGMPIFRIHPKFRFRDWFQYQIYWSWFIWGVATFWLSNIYDIQGIISGKYHGVLTYQKLDGWRIVAHIFGRLVAIFLHLGIPLLLFPVGKAIVWAVTFNFFFSFCFMATTQVNHLTPLALKGASQKVQSWAHHQVLTSQAFAHDSLFWWVFSGGLNYQIEHHIFPGVNHEHLPGIKPIVVRLCKKHGIPYNYSETYSEIFWQYIEVVRLGALKIHPGF